MFSSLAAICASGVVAGGVLPDNDPHSYWRILVTSNDGASLTQIGEVELFEDDTHVDVSAGGTYTHSSAYDGGLTAAKAFDDPSISASDGWVTSTSPDHVPSWIAVQLASPAAVNKVMLRQMYGDLTRAPRTFDVQYSDNGSSWTTKWSVTTAAWNSREGRLFTNPLYATTGAIGAHRYWSVLFATSDSAPFSAAEVEMRTAPGGADECTGGTPIASTELNSSWLAVNAFDNSNSTAWAAYPVGTPQRIGYDFGSGVTKAIVQVAVTARDTDFSQTVTRGAVQFSDDGTKWHTAWLFDSTTAWASNEKRYFANPLF